MGDHTVTVDPIGNSAWIHEGQDEKHQTTVRRGRDYDAKDVHHLRELLSKQTRQPTFTFVPSFEDLQKVPKFPSRRSGDCDVWRGSLRDIRGTGNLPVIADAHWNGKLRDVSKATIERQMYQGRQNVTAKALSRAGVPDHGLPSRGH